MSLSTVQKVYDAYAWFYDFMFGKIFEQGRYKSTNIINQNAAKNARVLELGVGTGLSLPLYRADLEIAGIDISEKMLDKARKRIEKAHLANKVTLKKMDAANLEYPDDSFDFVVAMYVASVVPDPQAFLEEVSRVCKPGGEIIFVNHFASQKPLLNFVEKKFAAVHEVVGFNSNFSINTILDYDKFKLLNSYNTNLFGYWKVLHCQKAMVEIHK